jgi:signal transduction histidine kinase
MDKADLLTPPTNFAIVQLPERRYPGVVMQGDTLHNLVLRLLSLQESLEKVKEHDLALEVYDLCDPLAEALRFYELTCQRRGIALPYPKRAP